MLYKYLGVLWTCLLLSRETVPNKHGKTVAGWSGIVSSNYAEVVVLWRSRTPGQCIGTYACMIVGLLGVPDVTYIDAVGVAYAAGMALQLGHNLVTATWRRKPLNPSVSSVLSLCGSRFRNAESPNYPFPQRKYREFASCGFELPPVVPDQDENHEEVHGVQQDSTHQLLPVIATGNFCVDRKTCKL